jgi:hypothetical protein
MDMDNISYPDKYMPEKRPREFFLKMYGWEDLGDLSQHVENAIDPANNSFCRVTECDEGGEFKGQIRVTMEFIPDNG